MLFESCDLVSKLSSVDVVKKMLDLMDESVLVGYPKDPSDSLNATTKKHCLEVAKFYDEILREHNLDNEVREALVLGALLHDVGKIIIPVNVLFCPGPINKKSIDLIKTHSESGAKILRDVANDDLRNEEPRFKDWQWDISIALAALHHNFKSTPEYRYPGENVIANLCRNGIVSKKSLDDVFEKGYGELFAVCDVYSAVSAGRAYSKRRLEFEDLDSPRDFDDRKEKCRSIGKIVRFEIELSELGNHGLHRLTEFYESTA